MSLDVDDDTADAERHCGRCGKFRPVGDFRPRVGDGLTSCCRSCLDAKAAYKRGVPEPKADDTSPEERRILSLVRRYELVRFEPGPARDSAYNALALALHQHTRPVSDGERQWGWAGGMGEVTSRLIRRVWRAPSDPHADPRRVARDELKRVGGELVEI